jgi:signal transduction histidine kinase
VRPRTLAAATAAGGIGLIVATAVLPSVRFAYGNPGLHVAIETTAVIVGSLVAYLAVGRYRRQHRRSDLLVAGGLGLLVIGNLALVVDAAVPVAEPGENLSTWILLALRGVGAGLLVNAALVSSRSSGRDGWGLSWLVSAITPLGLVALVTGIESGELTEASRPLPLSSSDTVHVSQSLAVSTGLALVAFLFALAAVGFVRRAERESDEFIGWMGAGCALAALADLAYLLFPPLNPSWFYTGDLLRLGAYLLWLVGGAREIARYWSELARMAVTEERRRMARDLHDGMAQELAFITTQAASAARGNADRISLVQLGAAAQRALDESRRAIAALTIDHDEPLTTMVTNAAEDVANRYGVGVHIELDDNLTLRPEVRDTLLWIVREAVTNAACHGRARDVTVEVRAGRPVNVRVRDDGSGFDPEMAGRLRSGFGLISMRERAEAIGAAVTIRSNGAGTTVEVG